MKPVGSFSEKLDVFDQALARALVSRTKSTRARLSKEEVLARLNKPLEESNSLQQRPPFNASGMGGV